MSKTIDLYVSSVFFQATKYAETRLLPGLCPEPRWGNLRRSPDPLVGWGGCIPSTPSTSHSGPRLVSNAYTWPSHQKGWTVTPLLYNMKN